MFRYLPQEFIQYLTMLYKSCIALHYTPVLWRKSNVIFLPKPGKPTYQKPKSFRPISLSNYFLKGLERLVVWRMDIKLVHKPIHSKQHGFTKGKSTESALSATLDYAERYVLMNKLVIGIFLDISSAFDTMGIDHIRDSLLEHGADHDLAYWYHDLLGERHITMEMQGQKLELCTGVGFPQGGVASAKFWLIGFDRAIRIINSRLIEGNGYADDCSALYGGTHATNMIKRMQGMLDKLTAWGRTCGLTFNACLLYTSPSPRDGLLSRMPSSA